ncbi:MAG: hypothetical protein ACYDCK_02195 [Thermoplasmatota archaeon]
MFNVFEVGPPLATALIALFPLGVLVRAYRRAPSPRLALAAAAFAVFVVSGATLAVVEARGASFGDTPEFVEFASDVSIVVLFALAFLWPARPADE